MRIPVTLITGFLGAGKSTLINRLMREHPGVRFGLVVNEFGDASLESQIIAAREGQVLELPSGCLCCVAGSDILSAVKALIFKNPGIGAIFIEASGLSHPGPIVRTFLTEKNQEKYRFDSILTLVDCENFLAQESAYPMIGTQVDLADFLLLSKVDLVTQGQKQAVLDRLAVLKPASRIWEIDPRLDTSMLLDVRASDPGRWEGAELGAEKDAEGRHGAQVYFHKTPKALDPVTLGKVLAGLEPAIIRAKGYFYLKDKTADRWKYVFQYTGSQKQLSSADWKKGEIRQSAVVFIGKGFDETRLREALCECEL